MPVILTVEAIAEAAGVSVQTVCAVYGSKAAILIALLDRLEVEAGADLMVAELIAAANPRAQLRSIVAFNRRLSERSADVIAMALGSAGADPDVAAHLAAGRRRRRASQLPIVRGWHRRGVLRQGLRSREAADVLWALTQPRGLPPSRRQHRLVGDALRALARLDAPHPPLRPCGCSPGAERYAQRAIIGGATRSSWKRWIAPAISSRQSSIAK